MRFFLDTANVEEIARFNRIGLVDGVTTNPALIAREGRDSVEVIHEICRIVDGPVSIEVVSLTAREMIKEARQLARINEKIIVKLPAIPAGFEALNVIASDGIKVNFTIVYTANQALLACKLGAEFVSPFVGRLEASSCSGTELIREIAQLIRNYRFPTKILAASMRNVIYVKEAALAGAHVVTVPPEVLEQMMLSELTNTALQDFLNQWNSLPDELKTLFDDKNPVFNSGPIE
jgi:transaldolase